MSIDAIVSLVSTVLLNGIALVVFIVRLGARLEQLAVATSRLAAVGEKLDERVDRHEVRISVLEASPCQK